MMARQMYSEKSRAAVCERVRTIWSKAELQASQNQYSRQECLSTISKSRLHESISRDHHRQKHHKTKTHLLPTTSPILNRIPRLHLHLLANRDAIIRSIIVQLALASNRFRDRGVDPAHLARLRFRTAILSGGLVRGEIAIVAILAHGGGGRGLLLGRRRRCAGGVGALLFLAGVEEA